MMIKSSIGAKAKICVYIYIYSKENISSSVVAVAVGGMM